MIGNYLNISRSIETTLSSGTSDQIVWGDCRSQPGGMVSINEEAYNQLRARLIQHNLTTTNPWIFTLGPLKVTQVKIPSPEEILTAVLKKPELWKEIAIKIISAVCLLIFKKIITPYLTNRTIGLKIGLWFFIIVANLWLIKNFLKHISLIYQQESYPYYEATQEITKKQSSLSGVDLSKILNATTNEGWEDPISFDTITSQQIIYPRYLIVDNQVFHIEDILTRIFSRLTKNGQFCHLMYNNSYMNDESQKKLVTEISDLFCISPQEFLDCCNVSLELDMELGEVRERFIRQRFLPIAMRAKFFRLIPLQIVFDESLKNLRDQELEPDIFHNLLANGYHEIQTSLNELLEQESADFPVEIFISLYPQTNS